jgi:hypothetical protein
VEIGGFIITGTAPKLLLVRAIGPTLGITGELLDPILELHGPNGFATIRDDDWQERSNADEIPSVLKPADALVEIYDVSSDSPSQLANLSTRALVESQDQVEIGGFIVGGTGNSNVIIRALGPSLANLGVPNPLADPVLEVRNKDGSLLKSNDNWKDDSNASQVSGNGLAPRDDLESALYLSVPPGEYTAIVSGAGGESGVGLVEVYHLE